MTDRAQFTVVFEGDISALPFNPMNTHDTPFGRVIAAGYGNAFDEVEELIDRMTPSSEALSQGTGCAGEEQHRMNPNSSPPQEIQHPMRENMSPEEREELTATECSEKRHVEIYDDGYDAGRASLRDEIEALTARAEKAEQQVAERARVLRAVQCQAENAAYNLGQPESGWCTKDATRAFHNISGTIEAALSSDSQEAPHV